METTLYFDSHAHYFDPRFEKEYPGGENAALADVHRAGVRYILNAGTSPETTRQAIALAEQFPFAYASSGLHPSDSAEVPDEHLMAALDDIRALCRAEKVVAIGEIGLDYYWDDSGKDRQKSVFDAQLSMAEELHLPVIIHDRDAHGDTMDILRAHPHVCGVLHSFSGSAETARQLTARGWYVSFSGPITYKNARGVKEAAAVVPLDRILIETDAPYLPPEPHRGKLNHSGYLPFTAAALGQILSLPTEEIAARTMKNAMSLFRITE